MDDCVSAMLENAAWRSTNKTHERYLAECRAKKQSPCDLMMIKVLRLEGFLPDAMHGIDEGFAADVCGNVMHEVMETAGWGSTQQKRAEKLDEELTNHYKSVKETVKIDGKVTYERVKASGDWPCFKAKAAATRHLVRFAVALAERFNSGSTHDQRRLVLCKALQKSYDIMKNADRFLTANEKESLRETSQIMMACYRNLALEALGNNVRADKMKPKLHETQHILEDCVINPMSVWLYADEDLQRLVKEIAVQCHPLTVPYMCLFRWSVQTYTAFDSDSDSD